MLRFGVIEGKAIMSKKAKQTAIVLSQQMLAEGIYDLWLATELAKEAGAGQFIGVYPKNAATLLPRPISICEVNEEKTALRLVYRVAGKGTKEFSSFEKGDTVEILGILGNGYKVSELLAKNPEFMEITLYGGGIGIPPMLQLSKELAAAGRKPSVFIGYRDSNLFLKEDFEKYGTVYVATEDGSVGTKGNVLTALKETGVQPSVMMACGPMMMLRAIRQEASERAIPAYISLEEHMACGIGACLGCVCRTTKKDEHSQVHNARICTEGPVFLAEEVEI